MKKRRKKDARQFWQYGVDAKQSKDEAESAVSAAEKPNNPCGGQEVEKWPGEIETERVRAASRRGSQGARQKARAATKTQRHSVCNRRKTAHGNGQAETTKVRSGKKTSGEEEANAKTYGT